MCKVVEELYISGARLRFEDGRLVVEVSVQQGVDGRVVFYRLFGLQGTTPGSLLLELVKSGGADVN